MHDSDDTLDSFLVPVAGTGRLVPCNGSVCHNFPVPDFYWLHTRWVSLQRSPRPPIAGKDGRAPKNPISAVGLLLRFRPFGHQTAPPNSKISGYAYDEVHSYNRKAVISSLQNEHI